ncbi:hypothetical protein [Microlunatus soli]|uniref:Lipoprotein n=1 Tax=Microlunatus soli TaxID=630515 RepID=A0A1H1YF72_9ACTN|nr:hypothetical protein [Microlunatus soli]SDT20062.1 hypothetical protein SAMN04489812_4546 [Microlunatus soli]
MARPAFRAGIGALLISCATMLTGCTDWTAPAAELPTAEVYHHAPSNEVSVATAVPAGTARRLTAPLVADGWFCAQVRRNSDGRAVWCRTSRLTDGWRTVQVAQFLMDDQDQLVWAWFPEPDEPADRDPGDAVTRAAVASLRTAWLKPRLAVATEVDEYYSRLRQRRGEPEADGVASRTWSDRHAGYSYSSLNGLIVSVRGRSVDSWPFGAEHYATTMSAAVGDLLDGGYDCHYPPQQICNRPQSNGSFQVTLHGDQIVSARFSTGSRIEHGRQQHLLTEEFPHGLTFVSAAVRRAVTDRLERSRADGTSFAGVVDGTVVIIDADRAPATGRDFATPLTVQIGAPLLGTLPI